MMVKSLFTTLLLILSLCAGLHSQSTTINGTAPAYKGKEIMVLSYLDHFTKTLNLEDICVVDSSGNFSLSVPSSDIKLVNLRCDYTNAHLYINPGSSYNVIFPALPAGVSKSINNTLLLVAAMEAAKLTEVVVLPTPPF